MTQLEVLAHGVTTNVKVTVFHAKVIAAIADVFDGEGRDFAAVQQGEGVHLQLDFARGHVGVLRFAFDDGAFGLNHEFAAEAAGLFNKFRIAVAIQEKLGDAIAVAEVDPHEGAFVSHALHPACQCHFLATVGKTKFATSMRSVHVTLFLGFNLQK